MFILQSSCIHPICRATDEEIIDSFYGDKKKILKRIRQLESKQEIEIKVPRQFQKEIDLFVRESEARKKALRDYVG
jgi:hypothetical protein